MTIFDWERDPSVRWDVATPTEKRELRLARSKAEIVRTVVVLIVLCCQILTVLHLYGLT